MPGREINTRRVRKAIFVAVTLVFMIASIRFLAGMHIGFIYAAQVAAYALTGLIFVAFRHKTAIVDFALTLFFAFYYVTATVVTENVIAPISLLYISIVCAALIHGRSLAYATLLISSVLAVLFAKTPIMGELTLLQSAVAHLVALVILTEIVCFILNELSDIRQRLARELVQTRTQNAAIKTAKKDAELARQDAELASTAKSEFLASMSHELRTPLNAILGFSQMLDLLGHKASDEQQKDYLKNITDAGNHLLSIVGELLDFSKIESNKIELELSEVPANEVITECMELVQPLASQHHVVLNNNFGEEQSCALRTDRTRFKQILVNLLSNAIRYNQDGGAVSINGYETEDGFLHLAVTDTGIGIREEDQTNIFRRFHQLDANPMVAAKGSGIGLGLAVCNLLVERLAGRIGLKSALGVGSTFWFELPLTRNQNVFVWTQDMAIGVDALDADHQQIIQKINKIVLLPAQSEELDRALDDLGKFTISHIAREEAVMEACDYPQYDTHQGFHRKLVDDFVQLKHQWKEEKQIDALHELRRLLLNWWIHHIAEEDVKISFYAQGKELQIKKALSHIR